MIQYIDFDSYIELDGTTIPKDGGNRHYQEFLEAQALGEAELVPAPAPDPLIEVRAELARLDIVLPRCVEDLISAGAVEESALPSIMQERLSRKRYLRGLL